MRGKIAIISVLVFITIFSTFYFSKVYAENKTANSETESTLVEIKERELSSLEDYEETYGSKSYGLTAYILHKVQIYSIPFCFLGIIIAAIHEYVIGVRHIEAQEKGLALMVTFITLGIICQVLPLIFTIVVKFGRE